MKLKDLLIGVAVLEMTADPELNIEHVAYDSRKVTSGGLFVAISGFATDGNRFIPMALEKGAVAVVTAKKPSGNVPYILVESDRLALALIGCNFYSHPAASMTMIGVTGTNGKTSTTLLLKQVLEKTIGVKVGLIGTMENMVGDEIIPTERTNYSITLTLSENTQSMTDADFTLASACIAMTCMDLMDIQQVTVISGDRSITLREDNLMLNNSIVKKPQEETK